MTSAYKSIWRGLEQSIQHRKRKVRARRRGAEPRNGLAEFVRNSPLAGTRLHVGRRRSSKGK